MDTTKLFSSRTTPAESENAKAVKANLSVIGTGGAGDEVLGYLTNDVDGPPILAQRTRSFYVLPSGAKVTQNDVEWVSHKIADYLRHNIAKQRLPIDRSGAV